MIEAAAARYIGSPVKRSEDPRILSGRGRFVDDVTMPGMLHAVFVRSPAPHARIANFDASVAREVDGVVAILTGAELETHIVRGRYGIAAMLDIPGPVHSALATDKVRFVGDPLAIVVAESRHVAEDASDLIEVEYEDLQPIVSIDDALDPSAPLIFDEWGKNDYGPPVTTVFGDIDAAFARADRVITARLSQERHQNVPMECRAILASFDPTTEKLEVWLSAQGVSWPRNLFAERLGMPAEKVRVRAGDVGGSFGLKNSARREEVAVAATSRLLGRPVKWIEDRFEHMSSSGHTRDERFDVEAAVTNAGEILGLKVNITMNTGSYPASGRLGLFEIMSMLLPTGHNFQALSFKSQAVISNKASYVSYRGPWAAETWMRERMIDLVARELGIDTFNIRLTNLYDRAKHPAVSISGTDRAGVTTRECLMRLDTMINIADFRNRQAEARAQGRYLGLGIATYIEPAPGTRRGDVPFGLGPEQMRMRMENDGSVTVFTGQVPQGHGHETTIAQITADQLGMSFEDITVVYGDTDVSPPGHTGGSRAATMMGGAALMNGRALRAKALEAASHVLEADVADLDMVAGAVAVRGVPDRAIPFAELIARARQGGVPATVDTTFATDIPYDGGRGGWSGGAHGVIIEVDIETGMVSFDRYVVVEDCGDIINPAIVDGQIRGGIAQGIGAVLLEHSAYDESGQYLSATFMDYLLPTASDVPHIEIEHLHGEPTDEHVNFRGVGEGGMIVAPAAVCNTIEDTLAPFGVRVYEQHLPPARILELAGIIEP